MRSTSVSGRDEHDFMGQDARARLGSGPVAEDGATGFLFEWTVSRRGKASVDGLNGRRSDACCWLGLPDAQAAPAPVGLA